MGKCTVGPTSPEGQQGAKRDGTEVDDNPPETAVRHPKKKKKSPVHSKKRKQNLKAGKTTGPDRPLTSR